MNKFDEIYSAITKRENYVAPEKQSSFDNWSVDYYRLGDWFAGMTSSGYERWVGKKDSTGRVIWRVNDYHPNPLIYRGISVEEFNNLTFGID